VNTYEVKNLAAKARLYCGVGCNLKKQELSPGKRDIFIKTL
jgi:hypothetical protein